MASRAVSRLLLILALIVAAHAFKPISSRSVVEQLLSAAESLSFVLPDIAEVRIAQASYLANALGQRSGERRETDSRLTENEPAVAIPAVLAFGQPMDAIGRVPCDKPAAVRKTRQSGSLIARSRPRIKPLVPELPEAMPLSRALAMTLPLAEVDLISMPLPRLKTRFLPRRAVLVTKAPACESNIIVAAENELGPNEGPQEEFEDLMFDLSLLDVAMPVEPVENEPNTPNPPSRNCPVELPEMIMPPQTVYGTPKQ